MTSRWFPAPRGQKPQLGPGNRRLGLRTGRPVGRPPPPPPGPCIPGGSRVQVSPSTPGVRAPERTRWEHHRHAAAGHLPRRPFARDVGRSASAPARAPARSRLAGPCPHPAGGLVNRLNEFMGELAVTPSPSAGQAATVTAIILGRSLPSVGGWRSVLLGGHARPASPAPTRPSCALGGAPAVTEVDRPGEAGEAPRHLPLGVSSPGSAGHQLPTAPGQ